MITEDELTRRRATALAAAKALAAGHEAALEDLRDDLAEAIYAKDLAENALSAIELGGAAHRTVYVPGDDEPTGDDLVLASLAGAGIYFTTRPHTPDDDHRWRQLGYDALAFTWQNVLEGAPLINISGEGAQAAVAAVRVGAGGA